MQKPFTRKRNFVYFPLYGLIKFCCLLCAHHRIRHTAQPQTRDESSLLAASVTSWYRIWNASLAAAAVDAWQSLDSGHCHPWGETQTFAQRRRRRRKPSVSWYSRVTAVLQPCYDGCKLQAIVWRTLYIVANLKPPVFAGLSAKCSRKTTDYEVQKECRVLPICTRLFCYQLTSSLAPVTATIYSHV